MSHNQSFSLSAGPYTLSVPTQADLDDMAEAANDPEIARWTTVPHPYSRTDAKAFVEGEVKRTWQEGGAVWAIREEDQFLGVIGVSVRKHSHELGFWLAKAARGRGVMDRVLPVVLEATFTRLGAHRIQWRALAGHWASWRIAWKHGFVMEGTLRDADISTEGEGRVDLWIASLLKGEPREPRTPWNGPGAPGGPAPDSRDPEALVRQFHRVYGLPIKTDGPDLTNFEKARLDMRMGLILEETEELVRAAYGPASAELIGQAAREAMSADEGERDLVETADALADLIYVVYGMALEVGIDLSAVLAQVQASNMSKLGADGKPIYREDGKVLKGPGFFSPDIAKALQQRLSD